MLQLIMSYNHIIFYWFLILAIIYLIFNIDVLLALLICVMHNDEMWLAWCNDSKQDESLVINMKPSSQYLNINKIQ